MNNKIEYFFNAIHYNIYLEEVWSNKKLNKFANRISTYVFRIPFIREYGQRHCERHTEKMNDLISNNKVGLSISVAHHWYGYFYSCYPAFLSFILLGVLFRFYGEANHIIIFLVVAFPIILCYVPAYRAVFTKDRYIKYFKQFEKEDEQWHRKWKWITMAFCVGSVVTGLLGIGAMWCILML